MRICLGSVILKNYKKRYVIGNLFDTKKLKISKISQHLATA